MKKITCLILFTLLIFTALCQKDNPDKLNSQKGELLETMESSGILEKISESGYTVNINVIENTATYPDGSLSVSVSAAYPELSGGSFDEFNRIYREDAENYVRRSMESALSEREKFDFPLPFTYNIMCEISYFKDNILSFLFTTEEYTGDIHSGTEKNAVTLNLDNADKMNLTDILNRTESEISELVLYGFSSLIKVNPGEYFDVTDEQLEYIVTQAAWYLTEKGITFVLPLYSIAPYTAGHPAFEISFENNPHLFLIDNLG